ncbi:MAG TPA: vWA domain-containing protein [Luteolibacter sp.]
MKTHLLFLSSALALVSPVFAKGGPAPAPETPRVDPAPASNRVQIALLLDTSNSMDGLIDQAKTQLWKVVNTFTDARRDGEAPKVEVALYEYGNNGLNQDNQWVRQVLPLTRDLDELSKALFALKTNGGEEYCGAVIQRALGDLSWDADKGAYKVLFIAGNEPFTQGPVDVRKACREALAKGVVVNTIHCGSRDEGMSGAWHDGAALGGGKFMIINQDRAVVDIAAPQDKRIAELGVELNKTYLGYGKERAAGAAKQEAADKDAHANAASGAPAARAVAKASKNYHNATWDLVDAVREKQVDPAKLEPTDLPEAMRGLKPEERAAFVEKAAKDRAEIQGKIVALNREREAFVAEELKKSAKETGEKTLDQAIIEATREQASALGYKFQP